MVMNLRVESISDGGIILTAKGNLPVSSSYNSSLFSGASFLESFTPTGARSSSLSQATAATTIGPSTAPFPASSTPQNMVFRYFGNIFEWWDMRKQADSGEGTISCTEQVRIYEMSRRNTPARNRNRTDRIMYHQIFVSTMVLMNNSPTKISNGNLPHQVFGNLNHFSIIKVWDNYGQEKNMASPILYQDRLICITNDSITFFNYYFPLLRKKVVSF